MQRDANAALAESRTDSCQDAGSYYIPIVILIMTLSYGPTLSLDLNRGLSRYHPPLHETTSARAPKKRTSFTGELG